MMDARWISSVVRTVVVVWNIYRWVFSVDQIGYNSNVKLNNIIDDQGVDSYSISVMAGSNRADQVMTTDKIR